MLRSFIIIILVIFISGCISNPEKNSKNCALLGIDASEDKGFIITDDLNDVSNYIAEKNLPTDSTLIVFDIDDTLLESKNFVGGDTWYRWQTGKPVYNNDGELVIRNEDDEFLCIHNSLSTFYSYGTYKATQNDAPQIVKQLKASYDLYFLTSRSPFYRNGTERELEINKFEVLNDKSSEDELHLYFYMANKYGSLMPVTVKNNIVMSTGIHKGKVLKQILKENKKYSHIVFIDDGYKNIENMKEVWDVEDPVDLHAFFYTRVDKCIDDEKITQSNEAKNYFDMFLMKSFPNGYDTFIKKECKHQ